MNDMRLLLIEDEAPIIDLATRILGPFASRIDSTGYLDRGLKMAEESSYDVIILDLRLIGSDRDEAVAAIPELKRVSRAPVVVVTGWPDPELKQRCLDQGADAFVNKRELVTTIVMAVQLAVSNAPEKQRGPTFDAHWSLMKRALANV